MQPAFRIVLVLALALAACARPAPPTTATPAPVVRAGTSGNYPPLSSWKGERPDGFAPALLEAFAHERRMQVSWTPFKWPELAADVRSGKFDVAADGITIRPERAVIGRFTVPIARGGAVLLVRPEAVGKTGLRVVVNQGGHLERVARAELHDAVVRAIPDNDAVRLAFVRGEADAALTNTFEAPRWKEGVPGAAVVGPITHDFTALWVGKEKAELAEQLDEWLMAEEASGRLESLRARMLGPGGGGATALAVDALVAATVERLGVMPFVAAAKRKTGRPVFDPSQEERVLAAAAGAVEKAAHARGRPVPARAKIEAFFRAQMDAAKAVQERSPVGETPEFSLDDDLRPAIARITKKMAFLLVRVPRGTTREAVIARARDVLDADQVERIAAAIAAFGED